MDPPDDVCTTLRTPVCLAASASRTVPTTLIVVSTCGSATEWRTSIWAARWKTTSGLVSASRPKRSASTMSALVNSKSADRSAGPRFSLRPELRSSTPATLWPSANRRSTSVDPMKPAAPVTSVRIGSPYRGPLRACLDIQSTRVNWVARTAAALIAVQMVVRAVLAFRGYFYWDDLILTGRAGTQGLLSPAYLFDDHDGHVMPGAFLVAGAITRLAPLNFIGPAISLVVLQLLASLALLRTLHVILGWRPVLLLPLTFALFTPLSVPAFAWWAAALNSLPMLAALAWVTGDAVLLVRTGNHRYAVTGLVVYFGGLLFFEKAAVIPVVAFTIAALYAHVTGSGSVADVWRRGARLWVSALTVTAAWIAGYLVGVDQKRWGFDITMTWDLLSRAVTDGIVPGLVGGPWDWQRWAPASPSATPPVTVMVLGWLA